MSHIVNSLSTTDVVKLCFLKKVYLACVGSSSVVCHSVDTQHTYIIQEEEEHEEHFNTIVHYSHGYARSCKALIIKYVGVTDLSNVVFKYADAQMVATGSNCRYLAQKFITWKDSKKCWSRLSHPLFEEAWPLLGHGINKNRQRCCLWKWTFTGRKFILQYWANGLWTLIEEGNKGMSFVVEKYIPAMEDRLLGAVCLPHDCMDRVQKVTVKQLQHPPLVVVEGHYPTNYVICMNFNPKYI